MKEKFIIVETTFANLAAAKNLAQILLQKKLAACVEFLPIESCYFWQEKIVENSEILVKIKTKNLHYKSIEKIICANHSYKIPQIVATQINRGLAPYLNWLASSTKS